VHVNMLARSSLIRWLSLCKWFMQDLARWCWSHNPKQRPTFSQIARYLLLLLEEEEVSRM
jgi:hypothetical protein